MKLNKCMSGKKIIFRVLALLPFTIFAQETLAACTVNTSSVTINAGVFTVQRDAAIGSPISGLITGSNNKLMTCSIPSNNGVAARLRAITGISASTPSYDGNGVFSTGLSGVGTVVGASGVTSYTGSTAGPGSIDRLHYILPDNNPQSIGGVGGTGSFNLTISVQNLFQLIKTDSTTSSGVINIKIAEMFSIGQTGFTTIPVYLTATVNVLACSVSTPNVNVSLPTVNSGSFTGVGNTLGDTSFTVGLQCDAGAKVNTTMNFSQDSDTTDQSVAAVTGKGSAGVASGVGIQLLYGSTPLKNNTLTLLKTSSGGLELPAGAFSARYFQTKSTVQAGTANTTATMTLTYQ